MYESPSLIHLTLALLVIMGRCTEDEAVRLKIWLDPHRVPGNIPDAISLLQRGLEACR